MNKMTVSFDRPVLADEAEQIEDALIATLHDLRVPASIADHITENTVTTESYGETVTRLYEITIAVLVGEYSHEEKIYFMGTYDEAKVYANSYLSTIWGEGEETVYDHDAGEDCYTSKDLHRTAQLYSVTQYNFLPVMTPKGAFHFQPDWKIK